MIVVKHSAIIPNNGYDPWVYCFECLRMKLDGYKLKLNFGNTPLVYVGCVI